MREFSAGWVAAIPLVVACNFSGSPGGGSTPDARPEADAAPEDAMGIDADPICDPITLRLTVDGETWTAGDAPRVRRTGDSVSLNAAASCSPTGNLSFAWDLKGGDFVARNAPASGPFIEIYPDAIGGRTLTLTLSDGTDEVKADVAFDVTGFAPLDKFGSTAEIRQMVTGGDQLWIATDIGPFTTPLADLENGGNDYTDVNSIPNNPTATIPSDVHRVAFDPDENFVSWVSLAAGNETEGFFFDRDAGDITQVTVADDVLEEVRSIGHLAGGGLRIVTTNGTRRTTDYMTVDDEVAQAGLEVVFLQGNDLLGGGDQLYLLDEDPSDNPRSIFDDGTTVEDEIQVLAVIGNQLWIGSANGGAEHGIGIIDDFADGSVETELLGTSVRAVARDSDGDTWVATAAGVARFKADWQIWIRLDGDNGLGNVDVRSLIVDEGGGRRAILAGTAAGLFALEP